MSRNTTVVVECANCGSDFIDGTVGNRDTLNIVQGVYALITKRLMTV